MYAWDRTTGCPILTEMNVLLSHGLVSRIFFFFFCTQSICVSTSHRTLMDFVQQPNCNRNLQVLQNAWSKELRIN